MNIMLLSETCLSCPKAGPEPYIPQALPLGQPCSPGAAVPALATVGHQPRYPSGSQEEEQGGAGSAAEQRWVADERLCSLFWSE